jgi:hypothetical protein
MHATRDIKKVIELYHLAGYCLPEDEALTEGHSESKRVT